MCVCTYGCVPGIYSVLLGDAVLVDFCRCVEFFSKNSKRVATKLDPLLRNTVVVFCFVGPPGLDAPCLSRSLYSSVDAYFSIDT